MKELEFSIFKKGQKNPNTPPTPRPPKGNPDHIRPPQIENPKEKPHRQPERRPPRSR